MVSWGHAITLLEYQLLTLPILEEALGGCRAARGGSWFGPESKSW